MSDCRIIELHRIRVTFLQRATEGLQSLGEAQGMSPQPQFREHLYFLWPMPVAGPAWLHPASNARDFKGGPASCQRSRLESSNGFHHDFLAGVPLHDAWAIDLPRTRSGVSKTFEFSDGIPPTILQLAKRFG
jgi:hypothetical protein